jgi:RNA polymerase-binding transcription factor
MRGRTSPVAARLLPEFKRRLLDAQKTLFRTIEATDEEIESLTAPGSADPREQATSVSAATLLSRLEGQEKHELDEIIDALARQEGGTYGLCERCGRSIPLARLRALPAARYCVGCQAGTEHRP